MIGRTDSPKGGGAEQRVRSRRSGNIAFLIVGLGLGQGAIFAGQTWLVAQQQLAFLALFGAHFTFAMLAYGIVDMGSLTTLARQVAASGFDGKLGPVYWPVVMARLLMAVAVCCAALAYALGYGGTFSASYVLGAAPGLLIWSFNAGGILDGFHRSGVSGVAGSLPYVTSAGALPFAVVLAPGDAGLLLGLAFSFGLALAVAATLLLLAARGHSIGWVAPKREAVRSAFVDGSAVLSSWLPGQLFYRAQIVLCGIYLGPLVMGLFIYAKQIANAAGQLIAFLRRVEFPTLVSRLSTSRAHIFRDTLRTLWPSLAAGGLGSAGLLAAAILAPTFLPEHFTPAAHAVGVLSPLVLASALYLTFVQTLLATGRYGTAARATGAMVMLGLVATTLLAPRLGISGLMLAEVAMSLFGTAMMLHIFRRIHVSDSAARHGSRFR